jgi:hypothetical protein
MNTILISIHKNISGIVVLAVDTKHVDYLREKGVVQRMRTV